MKKKLNPPSAKSSTRSCSLILGLHGTPAYPPSNRVSIPLAQPPCFPMAQHPYWYKCVTYADVTFNEIIIFLMLRLGTPDERWSKYSYWTFKPYEFLKIYLQRYFQINISEDYFIVIKNVAQFISRKFTLSTFYNL